jgi:alkaline phosphatase D
MPDADAPVQWELASDDAFTTIVAKGTAVATAGHGHSVHVTATPKTATADQLYYRFKIGAFTSPVGRTKLAPTGAVQQATFVSASCQNYEDGFYAAHRDVAEQHPDLLVWLGDYIYEGAGSPPGSTKAVRNHVKPEPKDLVAYRDRYALYKLDPNLQAAHAACPWFIIWDDHEVENNYAALMPENPAEAPQFPARRQAAYKAWWEHQPVRLDPPPDTGEYRIYRAVQWGDLFGMALLDTRQYRTDQACGDAVFKLDAPCPETFDDARTLTGPEQEQWLFDTIGKQGTTWNVIGQQVVMANITLNGAVLNYDQWDGYPKDRQRILQHLADASVPNAIVLSGDIHLAGVALLRAGEPGVGQAVAVEFVDTSISSGGLVTAAVTDLVKSFKDIVDVELAHRGYTLHTVTPQTWRAAYRIVTDVADANSAVTTYKTFEVQAGTTDVKVVS